MSNVRSTIKKIVNEELKTKNALVQRFVDSETEGLKGLSGRKMLYTNVRGIDNKEEFLLTINDKIMQYGYKAVEYTVVQKKNRDYFSFNIVPITL